MESKCPNLWLKSPQWAPFDLNFSNDGNTLSGIVNGNAYDDTSCVQLRRPSPQDWTLSKQKQSSVWRKVH